MAGITLETAEAQLQYWIAADMAVSGGQSFEHNSGGQVRKMTRADAAEIRNNIDYWDGWCRRLDPSTRRSGIPVIGVIPT
ncbi:DUF6148 family protein [Desulfuromonas sp. KJ2020]|uniref:DUF6148 family protein n=1 Tax=Desulfuromonas sp. KJ2020 TaxID=2919173 RepID=UPI0020A7E8BC|nr:DUF6148 family protein [Desulfuromonas sp. KJ2020]